MKSVRRQDGFTIIELIMVIVIMGVIGGMVAIFMRSPIDAYFASARRAALTDAADTVERRMARDIRKALPNSINISVDGKCVEFIPTKTGGRYRLDPVGASAGTDLLLNGSVETTFNMLGDNSALPVDQQIVAGDVIVVANFGGGGVVDAFTSNNTAVVSTAVTSLASGVTETAITFPSRTFNPALAGTKRFQVIPANEKVVAFYCSGGNLYRIVKTTLAHVCSSTVSPTLLPTDPIFSKNVTTSDCSFAYGDTGTNARITSRIQMTDSGETVSLIHDVYVNNAQ